MIFMRYFVVFISRNFNFVEMEKDFHFWLLLGSFRWKLKCFSDLKRFDSSWILLWNNEIEFKNFEGRIWKLMPCKIFMSFRLYFGIFSEIFNAWKSRPELLCLGFRRKKTLKKPVQVYSILTNYGVLTKPKG